MRPPRSRRAAAGRRPVRPWSSRWRLDRDELRALEGLERAVEQVEEAVQELRALVP